jgi:heat shock protein HtpX
MLEPAPQPVLIYDRIGANRRNTLLLLGLFGILLLPIIVYLFVCLIIPGRLLFGSPGQIDKANAEFWRGLMLVPFLVLLVAWLEYRFSARLLRRLAGARPVGREEEPELVRTVENLCIGAGLPQPQVCVVESNAPNAFAVGLRLDDASLVVTRGLLDLLDRRELEGVIAHELSHIGNHDTRLKTIVAVVVTTLRLPVDAVKRFLRFLRGSGVSIVVRFLLISAVPTVLIMVMIAPLYYALSWTGLFEWLDRTMKTISPGSPLGAIITAILAEFAFVAPFYFPLYVFLLAPFLAASMIRMISTEREFLADADAALLTRNPGALARALGKISTAASMPMNVSPATTHLYIVEPVRTNVSWWERSVSAHPPTYERIDRLEAMGTTDAPSPERVEAEPVVASLDETPEDTAPAGQRWLSLGQTLLILSVFLAALVLRFWFLIRTSK